ncbi:MAG TPA: orotidine-5'-phosphate decarboxylase, partial [Patescibacteria group bacterium]|nr:orotidine-5'-phosphate decarboxylase [Patescibacteria group bacterium]
DAKRGDIGNTASRYAKAMFEFWKAGAVTVYPNLGLDAVKPFLQYQNEMTILLIKTSNPDSKVFQDLPVEGNPYYLAMANMITSWDFPNLGIFVGATYPDELKAVRSIFPERLFLTAGIGAQGGNVEQVVKAGIDKNGAGLMINASRSSIYVSETKDFAEKAREAALKLKNQINQYR